MIIAVRINTLLPLQPEGRELVLLPMSADDRRRVRRRLVAPDGTHFELALPTGTPLRVGQVLHCSETHAYVISAADEATLMVWPRDVREAALAGHAIGNLHRDVEVLPDGRLIALHDAPLEARLRAAGFAVSVAQQPFHGRAPSEHSH